MLTCQLASRCCDVTGLDLNSQVLAVAEEAKPRHCNVKFTVGDIMTYPFPPAKFTFLTSVATLHHLPLEGTLIRFGELLAPGGVLAIIGLYRAQDAIDAGFQVAGFIASQAKRRVHRFQEMSAPVREPQQTLGEIKKAARRLLPGSDVRRRLFFRYSLVWQKPNTIDQ